MASLERAVKGHRKPDGQEYSPDDRAHHRHSPYSLPTGLLHQIQAATPPLRAHRHRKVRLHPELPHEQSLQRGIHGLFYKLLGADNRQPGPGDIHVAPGQATKGRVRPAHDEKGSVLCG